MQTCRAQVQALGCRAAPRPLIAVGRRPIAYPGTHRLSQRCQPVLPAQAQQQYGGGGQGMYPPVYQSPMEGGKLDQRQEDMLRVGTALRNIGWLSFWGQLALTVVSSTILLFSTGFGGTAGPVAFSVVDVATFFGIICGYVSTFLAWSYTRAGRKLGMLQEVKLPSIAGTVIANSNLNLLGMGATIIALQAIVGGLVAKTLSSAGSGAYYGAQRAAAPPVAFDVFSVQACTNTIMAHFVGMLFSNWILLVVNKYNKRQGERDAAYVAETAPSAPPMPPNMY